MAAQSGDRVYAERTGIPGTVTAQEIADLAPGTPVDPDPQTNLAATAAVGSLAYDSTDGELQVFDGTDFVNPAASPAQSAQTASVASGSTLGLEQGLLAASGQVGKTVLAVAYTYHQDTEGPTADTKAQLTSLGDGNVMFVYASGADFNAGIVQEGPVFLALGEIYVVENVQAGTIITLTEGGYGFSQQRDGNDESPMPLMSYALSFKDGFAYAFRNSQTYNPGDAIDNQGWIHIVNGPLSGTLNFYNSAGAIVQGQGDIALGPWEYVRLFTSGNGEYRLTSNNPFMAAINADMSETVPNFYDSRLVLPLTNDGISWPRSGFISALYSGTAITNYVNDLTNTGASPTIIVNPGTPLDWDAAGTTGAGDADYEPRGATRLRAAGLVTAYSGADTSGLEASPLCPVSTFTQRVALPLHIRNAGDGGGNGIAIASVYTGTARVYEWNQTTGVAEIVSFTSPTGTVTTEVELIRRDNSTTEFVAATPAHQLHPASALISNGGGVGGNDNGAYDMLADFNGGYVEIDVPSTVVFNSEQNENGSTDHTFRGTSGLTVVGIHSDDDEQLTYGITPEEIRAEVRKDMATGLLYRRKFVAGTDTWPLA